MATVEARHGFRCQFQQNSSYAHILIQLTILYEALKDVHDLLTACVTSFLVYKRKTWFPQDKNLFAPAINEYFSLRYTFSHTLNSCPKNYTCFTVQYIPLPLSTLGYRWHLQQHWSVFCLQFPWHTLFSSEWGQCFITLIKLIFYIWT